MANIPSPQSFIFSDEYICRWNSCNRNFDDAEFLYDHVKCEHVGRKAQQNLCLTCGWENCSAVFTKRDHITSHVRVHVDLKPFRCAVCQKPFKRPQDLKKHEKIHTDEELRDSRTVHENTENTNGAIYTLGHPSSLQPPNSYEHLYQPPTPRTSPPYQTPPYQTPMSPGSMTDTSDSWIPGLASPYSSTGSDDILNSPGSLNQEMDILSRPIFDGSFIDVTDAFYGTVPMTPPSLEDIISPTSAKRSREGVEDYEDPEGYEGFEGYQALLNETLRPFISDAKKMRTVYDGDMASRLNAIHTILDITPLTGDLLGSSLNVNNLEDIDQLGQFCSGLFENIGGEVFEPQSYQPLFPDYEQKHSAVALDTNFDVSLPNFDYGLGNSNDIGNGINYDTSPDGSLVTQPQILWGTQTAPVIRTAGTRAVQQSTDAMGPNQYVSLPFLMNPPTTDVKSEQDDIKIKEEFKRTLIDVSTQTRANQMMLQRPADKQRGSSFEGKSSARIMESAPAVPDTPLPELDIKEAADVDQDKDKDQTKDDGALQSPREETTASSSTCRPAISGRYSDIVQTAKAKQAEAAAAAAATKAAEPLDPVEAMSRQLAQTHLDGLRVRIITKPSTTKPVTEGDMDRQIKAATARSLCENNPVRKHHAEVVLNLLKSIDELMAEHRKKVAVWKEVQSREASAHAGVGSATRNGSSANRGNFSVHNQEQIRTVSSFLSSRPAIQSSSLHQDLTRPNVSDYDRLHTSLADLNLADNRTSSYSDMPVLYPSSDHHSTEEEPFELTEEEKRYIEEDNARIAAGTETLDQYVHV